MAPCHRTPPTAIVDQRVDGLLKHAFFVSDDDLRRLQLDQTLEPVVAVDHATIKVVEIACGKASAVQLNHGAQFGRQHRQGGQNQPLWLVSALSESLDNPQAFNRLFAALAGRGLHLLLEIVAHLVRVDFAQNLENGLGAHAGGENAGEQVAQFTEPTLGQQLTDSQVFEVVYLGGDFVFKVGLGLVEPGVQLESLSLKGLKRFRVLGQLLGLGRRIGVVRFFRSVFIGVRAVFVLGVGLRCSLEFGYLYGQLFQPLLGLGVDAVDAFVQLLLELIDTNRAQFLVEVCDEVLREIQDSVQVPGRQVQKESDPAGRALGKPDVSHRSSQGDVPHPLTSYFGPGDFDAASVTDNALVADLFVLTAVALPILGRTENTLAEQPVFFRPQRPIVYRLGFGDFAVRPDLDLFRRRQGYSNCVEVVTA